MQEIKPIKNKTNYKLTEKKYKGQNRSSLNKNKQSSSHQIKLFIKNWSHIPLLPKIKKIINPQNTFPLSSDQLPNFKEIQRQKTNMSQIDGFQKWKLGKLINQGATASVYKVMNRNTGTIAAVKKILANQKQQQFQKRQLKLLCRINHPNIIKYMEHYQINNQMWIFMQYIPMTLHKFIKQYGPPSLNLYMKFAQQLFKAVDYLYQKKIFHKDIKCSNILFKGNGTLKLSDFGCSKGFDHSLSLDAYVRGCQTFKGSVLWMAPETITKNQYNRKTDIWSLGCTLLEMATGQPPWSEKHFDNQMAALWVIASQGQLPQIKQNLHQNIKYLIRSCLKRNPQERLTASQLLEAPFFKE